MKTFKDLKVGDIVYTVIFAHDSGYPIKVRKEKVTDIETVNVGTIIKTEDLNRILCAIRGYFIDPLYLDSEWLEQNGNELHCDNLRVQELINKVSAECQEKFTEMIDSIKKDLE